MTYKKIQEESPTISICVVTYNQKNYIVDCVESLARQELTADFDIIVADDCSTDGSVELIRALAQKYPGRVKPIFQTKNIGPFENYKVAHTAATGRYVAHMDGDDMAAPGKLSAQISYFERNPSCVAVFHKLRLMDFEGRLQRGTWPASGPSVIGVSTLIRSHPLVGHSSMMYRRGVISRHLRREGVFLDIDIFLEAAEAGRIGFINESLGFYRTNVGIATSGKWIDRVVAAIRSAESLGVAEKDVDYAINRQIIRAAFKELRRGDQTEFCRLLSAVPRNRHLEVSQKLLLSLGKSPYLAGAAFQVYRMLKHGLR